MLRYAIGAAILGLIIAIMEEDEFPGWIKMFVCIIAMIVPAVLINGLLPVWAFPVGLSVGAVAGGFAISALCGMSVKRASIAAGIWLVVQIVLGIVLVLVLG